MPSLSLEIPKNAALATKKISTAIGSVNKIKIQAVKNALVEVESDFLPCSAPSNVRIQPLSDEETLQGAINRATYSLEHTQADLAFGLEGGVHFIRERIFLCHWGALMDREQNLFFTNGPLILLPNDYGKELTKGESLETIMQKRTGIDNLGAKEGAVGIFTNGLLTREQLLTQMVTTLLSEYAYYLKPNLRPKY